MAEADPADDPSRRDAGVWDRLLLLHLCILVMGVLSQAQPTALL